MNMKKIISLLLVSALTVSTMVGCSKSSDSQGSAIGSSGNMGKYDETLTVSMIKGTNPALDQRMSQLKGITGETYEDNRWIRAFKDELNIDVEYKFIASGDNLVQKWRNAMATGDIPDIVSVSPLDVKELTDADLIHDMSTIFEENASDLTKKIIGNAGDDVYKAATIDGKLMGIPQVSASLDSYRYLWLREDWMKKLNLSAPKTMDDLYKIMDAFVNQDPDGNGQKDTYGMMLDNTLWFQLEGLFWGYGAYPDAWIENEKGELVFGGIQPEMKKALQAVQDMYKKGWIDKEFVAKDYNKAKEAVVAGKTGVLMGAHFNASDILLLNKEKDSNAEWGAYPWPSATGEPTKGQLELGLSSVLVVSKKCANPEAAIKMLNLYFEKLYGETGDYSKWGNAEVDFVWQMGPFDTFDPNININAYRDVQKVYEGELKAEDLTGVSKDYYNNVQKSWDWQKMFGKGENTAGYLMDTVASDKDKVIYNKFVGAPTPTMVDKGTQLGNLAYKSYTNIITGKVSVDEGFDKFVSDWLKGGGQAITNEVNEWYKSQK